RDHRDVADRTVGDHAEAAERLVHVRLHLAPERAVADMLAVEILHHHDAGPRRACDIVEIIQPLLHVAGLPERHRVLGFERHRPGEADDGCKVGKRAMQVLDGVAETAALGRDDLDQVAYRRGIDRLQKIEMASARRGHSFPLWALSGRPQAVASRSPSVEIRAMAASMATARAIAAGHPPRSQASPGSKAPMLPPT